MPSAPGRLSHVTPAELVVPRGACSLSLEEAVVKRRSGKTAILLAGNCLGGLLEALLGGLIASARHTPYGSRPGEVDLFGILGLFDACFAVVGLLVGVLVGGAAGSLLGTLL